MFRPIEDLAAFTSRIRLAGGGLPGTAEDMHLDFKEFGDHLIPTKPKEKKAERDRKAREMARDITQFANSDGGCLVLGVSEKAQDDGSVTAERITGVQERDKAIEFIEAAISRYVRPAFVRPRIAQIPHVEGLVLVVNVEPVENLIAVYDPGDEGRGIEYFYRTNRSKERFTPDEVVMRVNNRHRATRLELERLFRRSVPEFPDKPVVVCIYHSAEYNKNERGPEVLPWYENGAKVLGVGDLELELKLGWRRKGAGAETPIDGWGEITLPYDWIDTFWWYEQKNVKAPAIHVRAHIARNGRDELVLFPRRR